MAEKKQDYNPFSLRDFRAKMNGTLRPSHFSVRIMPPLDLGKFFPDGAVYHATKAEIPGVRIATYDSNIVQGPARKFPYMRIYQDSQIDFIVTENNQLRNAFEEWGKKIIHRPDDLNSGSDFDMGFVDDCIGQIIVTQYTMAGTPHSRTTFYEALPIDIGQVAMAWDMRDQIIHLPVTFYYRWYKYEQLSVSSAVPNITRTEFNDPTIPGTA